ncbi:MAG TPA: anti-sigma factor [Xanthobacteraceae bacterium]|nr:anti-sigma factor [Xanthobacteraceae bacterium]
MLDEEHDTLAAEYVLGTLSAEEREHAEALLSFDPGFEAAVRQWERRLGELNVMVEAVEPQPALWEKIKDEVTSVAPASDAEPFVPASEPELSVPAGEPALHLPRDLDDPAMAAALAADLAPLPEVAADSAPAAAPEIEQTISVAAPTAEPVTVPRSADVIYLATRVRRWQRVSVAFGAIAALLALYVATWQVAPELIPAQLRPVSAGVTVQAADTPRTQEERLVAVLQQGPNAPAFLLTLDALTHTLVVRRVSATLEAGKSYQLWLIAGRGGAPQSLGVVGDNEFTQRPVPANFNADTLRNAVYAVSLEPAGGSKSGAPSGPVLYTGKAIESLPASSPTAPPRT